jgi:manganese transport protein
VKLVVEEASPLFGQSGYFLAKTGILIGSIGALLLLGYIVLHPWLTRQPRRATTPLHPQSGPLADWTPPAFRNIAVALDFSAHDEKLLAYAIAQGGKDCDYLLIHVVESASARMLGKESDDFETRRDQERLDLYRDALVKKGYRSQTVLGFRHRSREIARIAKEEKADMLVIGAHGHRGLQDFIYGETVDAVRHALKIPVLIVNL